MAKERPEAVMIRLEREGVLGASAWFRDSEPFTAMVFDPRRFTRERATKKFLTMLRREVRDMWRGEDSGLTLGVYSDQVAWSGVHLMGFDDMIPRNEHDRRDAIEGLLGPGWAFVPTP